MAAVASELEGGYAELDSALRILFSQVMSGNSLALNGTKEKYFELVIKKMITRGNLYRYFLVELDGKVEKIKFMLVKTEEDKLKPATEADHKMIFMKQVEIPVTEKELEQYAEAKKIVVVPNTSMFSGPPPKK